MLLSTAYLPPISWFALLVQNSTATLEVYENFEKQSYRNRCAIYGPNGKQNLTVPVVRSGKTLVKNVRISYAEDWPALHWRSIQTAYKGRPFFDVLAPDILAIYSKRPPTLLDFNTQLIAMVCDWLQDDLNLNRTQAFVPVGQENADYRFVLHPKKQQLSKGYPAYFQNFAVKHGFLADLSIIDLLFSEGRASWDYLNNLKF